MVVKTKMTMMIMMTIMIIMLMMTLMNVDSGDNDNQRQHVWFIIVCDWFYPTKKYSHLETSQVFIKSKKEIFQVVSVISFYIGFITAKKV